RDYVDADSKPRFRYGPCSGSGPGPHATPLTGIWSLSTRIRTSKAPQLNRLALVFANFTKSAPQPFSLSSTTDFRSTLISLGIERSSSPEVGASDMIIDQIMPKSAVLHRDLRHQFLQLASCEGHYCSLTDGRKIFDSSGDAAVACLGHGHPRVLKAIRQQDAIATYCATTFFAHSTSEELCQLLVDSTEGHMSKAYIVSSGSEAMEAAMKLSRQFFLEQTPAQRTRYRFISRSRSYHGITLGALSVGGHAG
ncbi:hypothetical protein BN1708_001139, partial [Verticillium longisporum]